MHIYKVWKYVHIYIFLFIYLYIFREGRVTVNGNDKKQKNKCAGYLRRRKGEIGWEKSAWKTSADFLDFFHNVHLRFIHVESTQ